MPKLCNTRNFHCPHREEFSLSLVTGQQPAGARRERYEGAGELLQGPNEMVLCSLWLAKVYIHLSSMVVFVVSLDTLSPASLGDYTSRKMDDLYFSGLSPSPSLISRKTATLPPLLAEAGSPLLVALLENSRYSFFYRESTSGSLEIGLYPLPQRRSNPI